MSLARLSTARGFPGSSNDKPTNILSIFIRLLLGLWVRSLHYPCLQSEDEWATSQQNTSHHRIRVRIVSLQTSYLLFFQFMADVWEQYQNEPEGQSRASSMTHQRALRDTDNHHRTVSFSRPPVYHIDYPEIE